MSKEKVKYELADNCILRNGITIGEIVDGDVKIYEEYKNYRTTAIKILFPKDDSTTPPKEPPADGEVITATTKDDSLKDATEFDGETKQTTPQIVHSVRELVAVMQENISEQCPQFSAFYGDETDGVKDWLNRHVQVRKDLNLQLKAVN